MTRRAESRRASGQHERLEGLARPAAKWIAGADRGITMSGWIRLMPCLAKSALAHPRLPEGTSHHLQRIARRIARSNPERRQQIPLVDDRMTGRFVRGCAARRGSTSTIRPLML